MTRQSRCVDHAGTFSRPATTACRLPAPESLMLCRSREGTGPNPVTDKRRELHLNAFLMEAGHHEASWRLPDSNPRADFDLDHWIGLARLAESAKFDSLFLADGPATMGTGEYRPPGQLEPLTLLTALSQRPAASGSSRPSRRRITIRTTWPGGWRRSIMSVVAGPGGTSSPRPGRTRRRTSGSMTGPATPLGTRGRRSSCRSRRRCGTAGRQKPSRPTRRRDGIADPARIHKISHRGRHFTVAGPLNVERPPQGYPLLVQAAPRRTARISPPGTPRRSSPRTRPTSARPSSMPTSRSAPARSAVTRMA